MARRIVVVQDPLVKNFPSDASDPLPKHSKGLRSIFTKFNAKLDSITLLQILRHRFSDEVSKTLFTLRTMLTQPLSAGDCKVAAASARPPTTSQARNRVAQALVARGKKSLPELLEQTLCDLPEVVA